ncbi:chemotaxis protein MotB [Litorimonas taeanensis]|uniref:Chemotaxis protein MotB n=1 Tax=Litorimonas taeanensis TaxID=568099 RepID=A0A420WM92_9PROT|nr:flagellar motor protein MotB [Litorimonas taeanensis]RKQ72161.1 chemotaxis protein MotB [Litorimonas taeanensis]
MSDAQRPIIIRRKKVYAADGHHGGAWKVAYADFVTAMMAFFLLMWLLNATTEQQRKGIADYFNPNIPLAAVSGGGADALKGDSLYTQDTMAKSGSGAAGESDRESADKNSPVKSPGLNDSDIQQKIEAMNKALVAADRSLSEHLKLKMSPEGLVIELVDQTDSPLFSSGSAKPSPILEALVSIVSDAFSDVSNQIKIVGHTDNYAFSNGGNYTNWELSSDRANSARRLLARTGFPATQISGVEGKSSTEPFSDDPYSPMNRRISITILNSDI